MALLLGSDRNYFSARKAIALTATLGAAFFITACSDNDDDKDMPLPEMSSIYEIAAGDDRFDSLELALDTTGLDAALDDDSATYTVFAPTDDAFEKLGDTLNTLLANPDTLRNILQYHVINGAAVDASTAMGLAGSTQAMLNGDNIAITMQGDSLYINNAEVIFTIIEASNGIIHAIDTVITPPTPTVVDGSIVDAAVNTPELSTLVSLLQSAGLVDALADSSAMYTVFAPLNSAFDKIDGDALDALAADTEALTDVLTYHVYGDGAVDSITAMSLTGQEVTMFNGDDLAISYMDGKLMVNNSEVVTKDIVTNNGTVHLIDTVLMPPKGTIVDVAVADGRFTNLVTALQKTGLDETLADKSKTYTVFAPTDTAFEALGDTLTDLLNDSDTTALSNILLYHVIEAESGGSAINAETARSVGADGGSVETANGSSVDLSIIDDNLFINDAQVIINNIETDNGIIHVLDKVLIPSE
ncbi:MAG TPA: fasciclin domain-containing protein [Marinagarivorans sp.]